MRRTICLLSICVALLMTGVSGTFAQTVPFITLASTTSTDNSGLFSHILPLFEADTGIAVRVVAVGTGQAIRLAERGDADVLLVHHQPSEERFVAEGFGVKRYDVMFNDFVVVGPKSDPAKIIGHRTAADAFNSIADSRTIFASRGDNSGTHKAELSLWQAAGVNVSKFSGIWYREVGAGMGTTLNIAAGMGAYTMVDRATWVRFKNKGVHRILLEGDPVLFNQYGVIAVSPKHHAHIKAGSAAIFVNWLVAAKGQAAIAGFKVAGQQLFTPNAASAASN